MRPKGTLVKGTLVVGAISVCLCLLCIIESIVVKTPFLPCRGDMQEGLEKTPCDSRGRRKDLSFAFLMYGQARTLNRTHCSLFRNIVRPILDANTKRVHFFIHAEDDEDAWQYKSFMDELALKAKGRSQGGAENRNAIKKNASTPVSIQYTLRIGEIPEPSKRCIEILSKKYEKRVDKIVRGPKGSYPSELLTQLMYREASSKLMYAEKSSFDILILLRPDVEYADKIPAHFYLRLSPFFTSSSEMNTIHVPAWSSYGGINDRFMISTVGDAAKHYLSLYSGLCGGENNFEEGIVNKLPNRRKGLNAERIYAWWMKERGGYLVSTKLLANFVFYRIRRDQSIEDGPDGKLGRQFWLWNPSRSKWSDTLRRHYACTPLC